MIVNIAPHEREAMYQLVLTARAIADILKEGDSQQTAKIQSCAAIVEKIVDRLDGVT
jgi:hypothetical protein